MFYGMSYFPEQKRPIIDFFLVDIDVVVIVIITYLLLNLLV